MRILYIHQYFRTPEEGGALRSYYISTALAKEGHEVVMITSHNKPEYETKLTEGVHVHCLPIFYCNSLNTGQRVRSFFRFLRQARAIISRLHKEDSFDLCYATSTPLSVGVLALYSRSVFKIPYIFEVRDLWPEAPIQLGYIKNSLLKNVALKLEKFIYVRASSIIALSPGIADGIRKVFSKARIYIIPNMADCNYFSPSDADLKIGKPGNDGSVNDKNFVIGYFGAAGFANNLEYLITAAWTFQEKEIRVGFLIMAEGALLMKIRNLADSLDLRNTTFCAYGNRAQLRKMLNKCDAVYTSFGPYKILQTNSPNKFFDGLAAGKLSIVNTRGWLKELVEKNHCGFYADPENPGEFLEKIRPFFDDAALLREFQMKARQLAEQEFSRDLLCRKIIEIVSQNK